LLEPVDARYIMQQRHAAQSEAGERHHQPVRCKLFM